MSFDNLNNAGNKRVNLAFMILLTVIALALTVFVPFLNFFSLSFLPVPAALLMVNRRVRDAVICAFAGVILLYIFNYILATVLIVIVLTVSFNYRYITSKHKKLSFILASIFAIFVLSAALFVLIASIESRQNIVTGVISEYYKYVDNIIQDPIVKNYQSLLLIDSNQFSALMGQTQEILRYIPKLVPSFLLVYFGIASFLNYLFSYLFFKRYDISLKPLPAFKEWDLPWFFCWGMILGITLVIIPRFNRTFYTIMSVAGLNLMIIFGFLYLVLGASALWGFFERINFKTFWRYIVLIFIFLMPGLILFLPVFGLIDIWANFRKLKRT
ncbi:MAG: DUF2232 domain-containing protein [Actinobacteria bacterium]|nr:DUF2232 domain-containing protein [Actinomycetota bacterium]